RLCRRGELVPQRDPTPSVNSIKSGHMSSCRGVLYAGEEHTRTLGVVQSASGVWRRWCDPGSPGPLMTRSSRMPLTLALRIALRALARHKLRSGLSMLGLSIGVAAFLCSVAVGQGASRQIEEQIRNLGENLIWIEAGGRNVNGVRTGTHGTQ